MNGYYWVKYDGEWVIAEWQNGTKRLKEGWFSLGFYDGVPDSALDEIGERRLERPLESVWGDIEDETNF